MEGLKNPNTFLFANGYFQVTAAANIHQELSMVPGTHEVDDAHYLI